MRFLTPNQNMLMKMFTPATLLILVSIIGVNCVRIKNVIIPSPVEAGKDMLMKCAYDLEGRDLYSIKWYMDGNEFYRYIPKEEPKVKVFDTPGIDIDLEKTSMSSIYLRNIKLSSAGKYKCEISGDAPDFQTQSISKKMDVYVLPKREPKIHSIKKRYKVGDIVDLNCTSGKSNPAANITWLINGNPVPNDFTKEYKSIKNKRGLQSTTRRLTFKLQKKHLIGERIDLTCVSVVGPHSKRFTESLHSGYKSTWRRNNVKKLDNAVMKVSQTYGLNGLNGCPKLISQMWIISIAFFISTIALKKL